MITTLFDYVTTGLKRWHMRRRTKMQLKQLDDHILRDIGLHRDEIDGVVEDLIATWPELFPATGRSTTARPMLNRMRSSGSAAWRT
jgi:uncharacterized protein YjiS (DUF1127 family)